MAYWRLGVVNAAGEVSPLVLVADTSDQARKLSGYPVARIEWVHRDWYHELKTLIATKRIPLQVQSVFLMTLAALASSGQDISRVFGVTAKRFGIHPKVDRPGASLSERCAGLGLNPIALVLVSVGEQSGKIGELLEAASAEMRRLAQLQSGVMRQIMPGLIYFMMGVVISAIVPLMMMPIFERLESAKIDIQRNIMTSMADGARFLYGDMWWALIAMVIALVIFRESIIFRLRGWPVISIIYKWRIVRRGLYFAFVYRPLMASGVTQKETLEQIHAMASGADKAIYDDIKEGVRRGQAISDLINSDDFPETLRAGLGGFEQSTLDMRIKTLDNLGQSLRIEDEALANSLGRAIMGIGLLMVFLGISIMMIGILFPLMTIQQ